MRTKDTILILAGFGSIFVFLFRYYELPEKLKTQAASLVTTQSDINQIYISLAKMEVSQDYLKKSNYRIETWLKLISKKVDE